MIGLTDEPLKLAAAGAAAALWVVLSAVKLMGGREKRHGAQDCDVLVLSASQTGQAEELARHSEKALAAGGQTARWLSLERARLEDLQAAKRLLVVASTTGVGDAPDDGRGFEARLMRTRPDLSRQDFAVLALGERKYADFCAFGHRVQAWLEACGAKALQPCLEVDDLDAAALGRWEAALRQWGGRSVAEDDGFAEWVLKDRRRLNPLSDAPGLYEVDFALPEGVAWQAGDLAEIRTPSGHRRDYSIASLPEEGLLRLYVRQVVKADGALGEGSGLLTQGSGGVPLRLKTHRNFHAPEGEGPVLLVAAGSGLAGLRPHLIALHRAGRACWLVYGERHPETDGALREDMRQWQADGRIKRLDLCFSRDPVQAGGPYVQHLLAHKGDGVRMWLENGAVMVCGGLEMGRAVEAVLRELMGSEWIEAALSEGRYRRDLY